MSLSSTQRLVQYTLSGSGQTLSVPFVFEAASDLVVVKTVANVDTTLTIVTNYTVTGTGSNPATGMVVMVAGTAGDIVTIYGGAPQVQSSSYQSNDSFSTTSVELNLDELTILVQQLQLAVSRSLRVANTNAAISAMAYTDRAGALLAFDTSGNLSFSFGQTYYNALIAASAAAVASAAAALASQTAAAASASAGATSASSAATSASGASTSATNAAASASTASTAATSASTSASGAATSASAAATSASTASTAATSATASATSATASATSATASATSATASATSATASATSATSSATSATASAAAAAASAAAAAAVTINGTAVTGLTGGGTNLDNFDDTGVATSSLLILSYGNVGQWWKLESSTATTDTSATPARVRAKNYSTSNRVWFQIG